ncbi:MAG: hypothetical protein JXA33_26015 [Anaerolineae bacterium]|nr:hypothetical protein [Anaerolineae bacterium]
MKGIPSNLYHELSNVLLSCGPFSSNDELRATFTDSRITQWRHDLPEANSVRGRVDATIDFLGERSSSTDINALVLFLCVLADRVSPGNACHYNLRELAQRLEVNLKMASQEAINSAHPEVDVQDLQRLRDILSDGFNLGELRDLTFYRLGIAYEEFPQAKDDFVRELIDYHKRRRILSWLVNEILSVRIEYGDDHLIATLTRLWKKWGERPLARIKVALVIADSLYTSQIKDFINKLAEYLKIPYGEIDVIKLASGSTHILIALPEEKAHSLVQSEILQIDDRYRIDSAKSFDALDIVDQKAWYRAPAYEPYQKESSGLLLLTPWEELVNQVETSAPDAISGDIQLREDKKTPMIPKSNIPFICRLGVHKWTPRYRDNKSCVVIKTCLRCGKEEQETAERHIWGEPFPDSNNHCIITRECKRCKKTKIERREDHNWQRQATPQAQTDCEVVDVCTRCGKQKGPFYDHLWGSPEPESERSCYWILRCQRCPAWTQYREGPHLWEKDWVVDKATGNWRRTCRRCGKEEYKVRTSSA